MVTCCSPSWYGYINTYKNNIYIIHLTSLWYCLHCTPHTDSRLLPLTSRELSFSSLDYFIVFFLQNCYIYILKLYHYSQTKYIYSNIYISATTVYTCSSVFINFSIIGNNSNVCENDLYVTDPQHLRRTIIFKGCRK